LIVILQTIQLVTGSGEAQVVLNANYECHIAALINRAGCRVSFLNDGFVVIATIIAIFIIIIEDIIVVAPVRRTAATI